VPFISNIKAFGAFIFIAGNYFYVEKYGGIIELLR
jgi:hypothetical protein